MIDSVSVDVLITFYNQKECVDRTIESVVSQKTKYPINIVIGDDGSTDGTIQKIQNWSNKYNNITYFVMERDLSKQYEAIERVSDLRKKLLTYAKSKYLLFLDGDDYYIDEYKIDKQIHILEEKEECIACAHNVNIFWENENKLEKLFHLDKEKLISNKSYWCSYFLHAMSFMVRNITCGEVPKELQYTFFDDNSISLYYLQFGAVYYIPDVMCNYVQLKGSSWNDRNEIERNIINALDYYEEKMFSPKMKFYSLVRHSSNFIFLYRARKIIKDVELKGVWKKKLKFYGEKTLLHKLINYSDLSCLGKVEVGLGFGICWLLSIYRKIRRVFGW